MNEQYDNDLVLRAARGERTPRTPIWMMRQAGRTDPEYLRLRNEAGLPLEHLFRHVDWATRITLLPKRFGVDALIMFQDILTILSGMGAPFVFAPGPKLAANLDAETALRNLHAFDVREEMAFVGQTLQQVRAEVNGAMPVLGFAGAPLTLLVFLVEGKSFGLSAERAMAFLEEQPEAALEALDKITDMTIAYLEYQIASGAAAVQLFESAAFLLRPDQYETFALPAQQRIFEAINDLAPTILFARDWDNLEQLQRAGAQVISLPTGVSITEARQSLGESQPVQGNLDNKLLLPGDWHQIADEATRILLEGNRQGHIFNLSHGLLQETPFENVLNLVRFVKSFDWEQAEQ